MDGWPLFATCSYMEFDRAFGLPVQTSNGRPKHTISYPLVHELPAAFPDWGDVKAGLPRQQFFDRYVDRIATRHDLILEQAAGIRAKAGIGDDVPLVLLCFEQLAKKPDTYCHREAFRIAWEWLHPDQKVPELGAVPDTSQQILF